MGSEGWTQGESSAPLALSAPQRQPTGIIGPAGIVGTAKAVPTGFVNRDLVCNCRDVNPITLLSYHAFIVIARIYCNTPKPARIDPMLFLSAILRVWLPSEPEPNDLLAHTRLRLGHLGLTVIALVFVLVTVWQR
jgi:hypothetical protein